jgi:hypothetical protein
MLGTFRFLVLIVTAVALIPGGAHLFELPNKIGLPQDDYFVVQGIYRGWALFGAVIIPAALANLALAIMLRRDRRASRLAFAAFLLIAASLAVFFTWTFPANQATANWTVAPANWATLRLQWEYSHAINAVLMFAALCCASLGALLPVRR